jgi:FKBP-type peptidyl-prolyl cis-trans isomerase FkpA
MPPRPRPVRPTALLVLLAACASGGTTPAAGPAEGAAYAPSLGVDLAAMTRTGGGVYVRDLRPGTGRTAARGMQVRVRYTGWLPDGTPVDSTAAADAPVAFRLGNRDVIAGWEQGIVGMRVGGRRQLVVPPRLGYGPRRVGAVPPDAVLVFAIDLVDAR